MLKQIRSAVNKLISKVKKKICPSLRKPPIRTLSVTSLRRNMPQPLILQKIPNTETMLHDETISQRETMLHDEMIPHDEMISHDEMIPHDETIPHHGSWIFSIVFSTDGQNFATGSDDCTIKIWKAKTGECTLILEGHGDWVCSLTFSANGGNIASGSRDCSIKIWELATGTCTQTLEGHTNFVRSVAFLADERNIASGSNDTTIKVWEAATGRCTRTLEGHGSLAILVVFSANGRNIASASTDRTIKVWSVETGTCTQTIQVDAIPRTLVFDSSTPPDFGSVILASSSEDESHYIPIQNNTNGGYGLSADNRWILRNGQTFRSIPPEIQPIKYAISRLSFLWTVVVVCTNSGGIILWRVPEQEFVE